jgi:syntaxin-binding protein 1
MAAEELKCGLVGVTREILLDNMVRHATQGERFLVMVTDAEGRRVLSSSLKMSELAQEGVTHIEDLCQPRQPRSDMGAIYFIGPTQSSIDRLLFDFREDGEPMYSEAWVYCTGLIPDNEFQKLKQAGSRLKRALRCCRDLLVEFTPLPTLGGRAFTLGVPELTRDMYSASDERESLETPAQDRAVERLFQLCISLGESPEVAYFDLDQGSRSRRANDELLTSTDVAQVAMKLHQKLKDFSYDPKTRQPRP